MTITNPAVFPAYRGAPRHPSPESWPADRRVRLLLSVPEAASRLGIGRTLMYQLLGSGMIESVHVGRLHRVPADALDDYVARLRRDPSTAP